LRSARPEAESGSPVLVLCRKLVEAGHDPAAPLEACRGDVLCLRVRSIGEAAQLEIGGNGVGFIRRCKRRTGPWVRGSGSAGYSEAAE